MTVGVEKYGLGPVRFAGRFCSGLRGRRRTYHAILKLADHVLFKNGKICPPATSEAGAKPALRDVRVQLIELPYNHTSYSGMTVYRLAKSRNSTRTGKHPPPRRTLLKIMANYPDYHDYDQVRYQVPVPVPAVPVLACQGNVTLYRYVSICSKRARNNLFCAYATSRDALLKVITSHNNAQHGNNNLQFLKASRN
jgi:hypothetical protein